MAALTGNGPACRSAHRRTRERRADAGPRLPLHGSRRCATTRSGRVERRSVRGPGKETLLSGWSLRTAKPCHNAGGNVSCSDGVIGRQARSRLSFLYGAEQRVFCRSSRRSLLGRARPLFAICMPFCGARLQHGDDFGHPLVLDSDVRNRGTAV